MSGSQDKKLRKKIRKQVKLETPEAADIVQKLILNMSWLRRVNVALKIIRGKPFFGKTH